MVSATRINVNKSLVFAAQCTSLGSSAERKNQWKVCTSSCYCNEKLVEAFIATMKLEILFQSTYSTTQLTYLQRQ